MRTNDNWRTTPLDDFTKNRVLYWIENTVAKEIKNPDARKRFRNISQFVTDQLERNKNEAVFLSDAQINALKKEHRSQARTKEYEARYGNSFASDTEFLGRKFTFYRG